MGCWRGDARAGLTGEEDLGDGQGRAPVNLPQELQVGLPAGEAEHRRQRTHRTGRSRGSRNPG